MAANYRDTPELELHRNTAVPILLPIHGAGLGQENFTLARCFFSDMESRSMAAEEKTGRHLGNVTLAVEKKQSRTRTGNKTTSEPSLHRKAEDMPVPCAQLDALCRMATAAKPGSHFT